MNARDHAAPPASFNHTQDGDQQRAEPDQEKLQNLIEDRGKQPARRNVHTHSQR